MKFFVLVESIGRELSIPEFFGTLKEAKKEMRSRAKDCQEYEIEDMSAYGTTKNDEDWDAVIYEQTITIS